MKKEFYKIKDLLGSEVLLYPNKEINEDEIDLIKNIQNLKYTPILIKEFPYFEHLDRTETINLIKDVMLAKIMNFKLNIDKDKIFIHYGDNFYLLAISEPISFKNKQRLIKEILTWEK